MLNRRTDERSVASAPPATRGAVPALFRRLRSRAQRWLAETRAARAPVADPVEPVEFVEPTASTLPHLPPEVAAARAAFRLPPRGRYEPAATLAQKRALERHGGRDYELIESLGDEQAEHLLRHLEREAAAQSAQAQRAADRARRGLIFNWTILGLVALDVFIVGGILSRGGTLISQDSVVFAPLHAPAHPSAALPSTADPAAIAAAAPAHAPPAPTPARSAAFMADVGYSKAKALARYPALGLPGNAFNARFVARYETWREAHDPRLERSNWPETLAYDCASNAASPPPR